MLSIAFILGPYFPSHLFLLTYSALVRTDILMIFMKKETIGPAFGIFETRSCCVALSDFKFAV